MQAGSTSAAQTLEAQSLETRLGELSLKAPVSCRPSTSLRDALETMDRQCIGAMLVTSDRGEPVGILTRHDMLARVVLAAVSLETAIEHVMVQPVHGLTSAHTAVDAALLMSRKGIRHVPITQNGVLVGIVSERDLFAMQRPSIKHLSMSLRVAPDVETLKLLAGDIRQFAHGLQQLGVHARQLTALVSQLNDVLTERLLSIKASQHGVAMDRICWLALGSEGRSEQTISTDQDNALILPDDASAKERAAALAFAKEVNLALDACGYPLCKGGIMAGNPECNLGWGEWRARFAHWIEHGAPEDLLNASIYFDLRPLAGDALLADRLSAEVQAAAQQVPRFLKQMALNAQTRRVPLNWLGGIATDRQGCIDLKLQGTAIFVDAARIYGLAHGIAATETCQRLELAGSAMGVARLEYEAWISGFEFLQMLRLRSQLNAQNLEANPNQIRLTSLDGMDKRLLKEAFRAARSLQQRLQLDYER